MAPQNETEPPGLWNHLDRVMIVVVAACIIFVLVGPDTLATLLAYLGIALGGVVLVIIPVMRSFTGLFRAPPLPQRPRVPPGQVYLVRSRIGVSLLTAGQELPPESNDTVVQELWAGQPIKLDIVRDQRYPTNDDKVVRCTLALRYTFKPDLVDEDVLPMLDKTLLEESPAEIIDEIKNLLTIFFEELAQKQAITQGYEPLRAKVQALFDRHCRCYGLVLMPDFLGVNLHIDYPSGYTDVLEQRFLNSFGGPTGYGGYDWGGGGGRWPGGGIGRGTGGSQVGGGMSGSSKSTWSEFKKSIIRSITDFASLGMHFWELVDTCSVEGALLDDLASNGIRFDGVTLNELALYRVDYRGVSRERMVQMGIRLN